MSYIDGHPHELIGLFAGIPVYRPLEDIPEPATDWPADDYGCSTSQLVIGGGAGEHPGMVLGDPVGAVAAFVLDSGDFDLSKAQKNTLSDAIDVGSQLHFAGWSVEDYHGFFELCGSDALPNPYTSEAEISFETWLHLGLGEFVYYAMPELAVELIETFKKVHVSAHHMRYNNILCVPPGIPVYANGGNAFFKS